jgi:hypothetical protein
VASAAVKPVSQVRPSAAPVRQVAKIRLAEAKINPFVAPTTVTDARTNPFVLPTVDVEETPSSPAPETISPKPASAHDARSEFVRMVHDDACHTFGTVLGPAANEAHKNHFHLDMKARRHAAVCE